MEVLDCTKMAALICSITEQIKIELYKANRLGTLKDTLKKYNLEKKEEEEESFCYLPNSKLLIIGAVNSNKKDIYKVFKNAGISPDKIDIVEDFDKLTGYDVNKLRYNTKYSDILVCAIPHKMKNIGDYPDMILMIEHNQAEFPLLNKVTNEAGELKFSINGLKKALEKTKIYKAMVL